MTIRAVVFDIGNVLLEWAPEAFFDRVIGTSKREAFFAAVPIAEMNVRVDAGANFHDEIDRMIAGYPDRTAEIALWRDRWIEMVSPAIDHSVRLLRALRHAGHPVFALSNFGKETFEIARTAFPFLDEFDQHYISAHLGISKPNPAIYHAVETGCGISPDALLFTDDLPANITAAAQRGWQTHLFDGPQGLADRLVAEGLLTQEAAQ